MANSNKKRNKSIQYSQNFLVNPSLVRMLIKKARISRIDTVIEIGPGRGIITRELAKAASKVIAVEKDKSLAADLRKELAEIQCVAIVNNDFLNFQIKHEKFKIFSNPPFNVTTKIIRKLVQLPTPPRDTYLVMQHEAANRIASLNQEYLFSVQFRPWFTFKSIYRFSPNDFRPKPGVRTVLFRIGLNKNPPLPLDHRKSYQKFVATGITGKAPTLRKNLQSLVPPKKWKNFVIENKLETDIGPLELDVKQWVKLYSLVHNLDN